MLGEIPHVSMPDEGGRIRVESDTDSDVVAFFEMKGIFSGVDVDSVLSDIEDLYPQAMFKSQAEVFWRVGNGNWRKGSIDVYDNVVDIDYGKGVFDILSWMDVEEYKDIAGELAEYVAEYLSQPYLVAGDQQVYVGSDSVRVGGLPSVDPEEMVWETVLEYAIDDLEDQGLHCSASSSYVTCIGNIDGTDVKVVIRK